LDAIGAESVDVRVVNEVNSVQVDDAEIWCCCFQLVNVDDFLKLIFYSMKSFYLNSKKSHINFLFFLLHLFISSNQVQHFKAVDKVVNFSHETFHEDDFGEANAEIAKLGGKRLKFTEIVKLHG
jgi:hypothetical protein